MSERAPSSSSACHSLRRRVWAARNVASSSSNCGPVPARAATINASSTPAPPASEMPTMSTYTVRAWDHDRRAATARERTSTSG